MTRVYVFNKKKKILNYFILLNIELYWIIEVHWLNESAKSAKQTQTYTNKQKCNY